MRRTDDTISNAIGRDIGRYLVMLLVIFVVLKACDLIDWRWVAVLIPAWCEIANAIICGCISTAEKRRRKKPSADELEELLRELGG